MPFYDYECTRCGATVELLHGIDDETKRAHEGCGGALERRFSATSVHFKGSGWAKLERRGGESSPAAGGSSGGTSSASPPATPSSTSGATPVKKSGGAGE
jgi:putative FmdB family regulatory protein